MMGLFYEKVKVIWKQLMYFHIFEIKMSFHKVPLCWQCFKQEGKKALTKYRTHPLDYSLFTAYENQELQYLFGVIELTGAYDIGVCWSLIIRGMVLCSFVLRNRSFVVVAGENPV